MSTAPNDHPTPYASAALGYFEAGWRSILPLPARRKKSPLEGYTGRSARIPSFADVYAWTETHGAGNIALRMPPDVIGIDVDVYDGKTGDRTIAELEAKWGRLPPSWKSSSRSGPSGIRFYRIPADPPLHWPGELPGGDVEIVQAVHRYAIVAPSVHPLGGTYRWTDRDGVETLRRPGPDDFPALPDAWVAGLTGGVEDTEVLKVDVTSFAAAGWLMTLEGFQSTEPCRVMATTARMFVSERKGSMHEHMNRFVLRTVAQAQEGHRGGEAVLIEINRAFMADVTAPGRGRDGERGAADEWNRGLAGAVGRVMGNPSPPGCDCDGQLTRALLGEPVQPTPWDNPGAPAPGGPASTQPEADQEAPVGPLSAPEVPPGVIVPLDWSELFREEQEESWVCFPILPERRQVLIHSQPKVGKSLLMLELAVAVANGRRFLGHPTTRRRVLYVDFENDPRGDVRTRLEDMEVGPADLGDLVYLSYPDIAALNTPAGGRQLLANALHHECPVVVIDTISRAIQGEENSNDTWLGLYTSTGLQMKRHGISMIRLDHSGKDDSKGARGGSAKNGDVDAVWAMTRVSETTFQIKATHRRFQLDEEQATITFQRQEAPLRSVVVGGSAVGFRVQVTQCVADLVGLDVDPVAGRTVVTKALKLAGFKHTQAVIKAAIRDRKEFHIAEESAGQRLVAAETASDQPGQQVDEGWLEGATKRNADLARGDTEAGQAGQSWSNQPSGLVGQGHTPVGVTQPAPPIDQAPKEQMSDCNGCGKSTYDAVLATGRGYCVPCARERT